MAEKTLGGDPIGIGSAGEVAEGGAAYLQLKDLLVSHRFRPNERLTISRLIQILPLGRTPLREALIRLAVEELITHVPNDGFYTKPLVLEEMRDHYELGFVLLCHSITPSLAGFDISDLRKPMSLEFDRSGSVINVTGEFVRSHVMFIEGLYRHMASLSRNGLVLTLVKRFNLATTYVRELDIADPQSLKQIATDMMQLVGYLQARRSDLAVGNMKEQLSGKLDRLPALVREANSRDLRARPL